MSILQGGASPKGTALGWSLSSPVCLGFRRDQETAETMLTLMLRHGLSLKVLRRRVDEAFPREKTQP